MLPKVDSAEDLTSIANWIPSERGFPIKLIASIESAKALWSIGDIASWKHSGAQLSTLLVCDTHRNS